MSLKRYAVGLAAVGISSAALAQPPAALPFPAGPGAFPPMSAPLPGQPGALGIAPRPALPTQNTLWSYLGVSADQREYRQRARADTPLGQLRSRLPGGAKLNTPSLAELQAPGAVGAAAQVKLDRANAEKRMEAVELLGTVDCPYWPEAEEALVGALRGDRNESVRLQAANALLNGCCCTKKIIKALSESAAGTNCDGFPAEKSSRVREAAQTALEKCLACFCEMEANCEKNCGRKPDPLPKLDPAPQPKPIEKSTDPKKGKEGSRAESYYDQVAKMPSSVLVADARKALSLSIPIDAAGTTINQLDLMAAGEPGPDAAGLRSPKPTSLMNWFSSKPATPGVTPIAFRPMAATSPVVRQTPSYQMPPYQMPALSMMEIAPANSMGPTAPAKMPPVAQPKPMPANYAVPQPQATRAEVATPTPTPTPTTSAQVVLQASRGDKVSKMMKGLVPVSELAAAIDQLTTEDLRNNQGLTSELVAVGGRSTSVPVRLATVQALVRCHVTTAEAQTILQTAAQSDPEMAIRSAAQVGVGSR